MRTKKSTLLSSCENIQHAYTTRIGGHSILGNNLAYHVHDTKADVDRNQNELAMHLGYTFERLVHMDQVHGDKIIIIDDEENTTIPTCDAIMTRIKNRPLMVMVADCIPVLIYDPVQEAIAAVHAGRAGVFSKIVPKSIKKMQETYGSNTQDLLVHLGPSIHQCCYEVGQEIKEETEKLGYAHAIRLEDEKYFLDLHTIVNEQLQLCGIRKEKIEISSDCTACDTDLFYSYRAEKSNCGRFAGVIMLR